MLKHYLTVAFRNLWKYKGQSLINIIGLAVGFTAFTLGGYWWYWENHFDNFHPDSSRIFAITTQGLTYTSDGSPTDLNQLPKEDAEYFIENIPQIEDYSHIGLWHNMSYKKENEISSLMGMGVDKVFFRIFQNDFINGGINNIPFDGTHIILTEKAAQRYLLKTDCAGEIFPTTNASYTIAGIIKDYPTNTEFRFEYLILNKENQNNMGRSSFYVLLGKHSDISSIKKKIREYKSRAIDRFNPEAPEHYTFHLRSLSEVHLLSNPELFPRFRNIELLGVAGILTIICALMNCLTTFIGQQQRKHSKNKTFLSIGASRSYLFMKDLLDLLVPIVISLILFIVLIHTLFPFYQYYTRWQGYGVYENYIQQIEIKSFLSFSLENIAWILLAFICLNAIIIRMMFAKKNISSSFFQNALIVGQVFIGCFFLFISFSLYRQFHFTEKKDKGMKVENISQIHFEYNRFDSDNLRTELLRSPFIEDVTFTPHSILTHEGNNYLTYLGQLAFADNPDEIIPEVNILIVEPNFINFFDIKLKEGDWMRTSDEIVVNTSMQKNYPEKMKPGKQVKVALAGEATIKGIIDDFIYSSMFYPVKPLLFHLRILDNDLIPHEYVYVKSTPENRQKAHEYTWEILAGHGFQDVEITELSDILEEFNRPEKELSQLFGFLSLTCILIVCVGIYSLLTFSIERRRKEIAIRKINGAAMKDILFLFIKKYAILLIIGNLLALPIAYRFIDNWLESYAYRANISGWLPGLIFLFTCLIVLGTIWGKVGNAAKENPAETLKTN